MIGDCCARLRDGAGAVVVIEGPAGMGKSRLLDEAARLARRMSVRVGAGGAEPSDGVVEMAPVLAALFDGEDPLLDRSAVPDLHALPEQRYWLLRELETLLEQAALAAPLLVCLDDLQWADSGTAAAMRALPSRLAALPIVWAVAFAPRAGVAAAAERDRPPRGARSSPARPRPARRRAGGARDRGRRARGGG